MFVGDIICSTSKYLCIHVTVHIGVIFLGAVDGGGLCALEQGLAVGRVLVLGSEPRIHTGRLGKNTRRDEERMRRG